MGVTADLDRLDRIHDEAMAARQARARLRREPPLVRLWEPTSHDLRLRGQVAGEYQASWQWKLNDTGAGRLELPYDHHLARWAIAWWERDKANIVVTVDKDGARWSGMLEKLTVEQADDGVRTVILDFLHDFEQIKHLPVWPNPFTPAGFQFPKTFQLIGPAAYILKVTLFLNLLRQYGSLWQLPDDPLDPRTWITGLDYRRWPMLVKPKPVVLDSTPIRYLHSRFTGFEELAGPILEDCRLMVTCRRWLVGDPQPWPGAGLNRNGQIIVDIVDKSGWFEQTATGGTIAGGLVRTGLEVADNLVDEARFVLEAPADAPEYAVSGFLGVAPKQPWVVYRTTEPYNTAVSTSCSWQPATVGQVTVGGKSMPGVNELTSANVQLVFNILGSFILQPSLGGIADSALKPLYEDTLLAFMSLKSPLRTRRLGWGHYMENFATGGDKAYTLSSLLALRKGFRDTAEEVGHELTVADGAPYLIGDEGQGHFFLGDRIGAEIPGTRDGRVQVSQVTEVNLEWSADRPHEWSVQVGAFPRTDPVEWAIGKVKELSAGLQEMGLL